MSYFNDGSSLRLGLSSEPGKAARAQVLQTRPIYRVGQASGSSIWSQAQARLELRIRRPITTFESKLCTYDVVLADTIPCREFSGQQARVFLALEDVFI